MSRLRRVPPGRAGRLWLAQRLSVARRGADLLDHKLRILHAERQRLALLTERTTAAWEAATREADIWLRRGALLGGQRAVRLAAAVTPATVEITWAHSMGVRYPAEGTCTLPENSTDVATSNTALIAACEGYRRALEAAVQKAVADAAARVVEREEVATRRRLRAIEDRWIPQLEDALTAVQLGLEEAEHADRVRLRWAAGQQQRSRSRDGGRGSP